MTLLLVLACAHRQPRIVPNGECRAVRGCGPGATLEACADPAEEAVGTLVWYRLSLEADGEVDFSQMLVWTDASEGCSSLRGRNRQ